jgi:ADP-ribosylglycohydrolase
MTEHFKHRIKQLLRCIIFGVAVGDALGFPVQFQPRPERKKRPVVDMGKYMDEYGQLRSWGEEHTGLWSDDTSLTLCLAESLLKGFDLKDQAEKFLAWLDEGYMSAREHAFDVGLQTAVSLVKVRLILHSGRYDELDNLASDTDEWSNGNGSLMRILPLLVNIKGKGIYEQFDLIHQASALTHPHIRSALCCFLYLRMAEYIVDSTDKYTAFQSARQDTLNHMECLNCADAERKALSRLLYSDLAKLPEEEIDSGGYVVSSLEASIWCLLNTDSFHDAVLKAVNLGDDTDTTGAITGGLAALLYGVESIPPDWITQLRKPELFEDLISRFKHYSTSGPV